MKKVLLTTVAMLFLGACSDNDITSLKGKNFVLDNSNITLSFDENNKFYGKALNNYFGNYSVKNNTIRFSSIGSTMMAGPEDEMKQEYEYLQNLNKVQTYSLKDKALELKGEGVSLKYKEQ